MAGILVVHNFEVETDIGECQIQLCVGDITSLPKEDKVDVLVLSAFPGDYSPSRTSLIGQLHGKLGVSVRNLAKDKEEDLRSLYSCWWSKPLSDNLSFKKILCFEGSYNRRSKQAQVIGDVFRCLVPILENKEGKVIMPLLSTGDQGFSKNKMLKLLVNAAVHWMKAGLQLRCLKIVLFSSNVSKEDKTHEPLITLFQKLKENYKEEIEMQKSSVAVETYDIYLSYSEEDKNYVIQVVDGLKQNRSDLRIFLTIQELDVEESWQEKLYSTITTSKRVMALLTPSYLSSARCTEQYNIALCHSRKVHQNILVPLYISEVPYMPTYMKLTQYIDCRFDFVQKLSYACVTVVSCLTVTSDQTKSQSQQHSHISDEKVLSTPHNYDVFLSYSHCNEDKAQQIMKVLLIHNPNLDIFIDKAQLKAGAAWQQELYDALDNSKSMIALVSNDYLLSKVCMEEFSLSLALQQQNNCRVLPLIIEPLKENMEWLSLLSPVKCFEEHAKNKVHAITGVCKNIVRELELEEQPGKPCLGENEDMAPLVSVLEETRSLLFQSENHFASLVVGAGHQSIPTSVIREKKESTHPDIYIISSSEDTEYCHLLHQLILSQNPSLVVKKFSDENSSTRLTFLDEARLIIPLLSSSFMQSAELVHELNIAWCRQRTSPHLCFLAITVDHLPDKPTYIRIFPSFFNCLDRQWLEKSNLKQHAPPTNVLNSCKCPQNAVFCLMAAADELNKWLVEEGQQCCVFGLHDKFMNYFQLSACVQRSKEPLALNHGEEDKTVIVESALESKKKEGTRVATANTDLKFDAEHVCSSLNKLANPLNRTDNHIEVTTPNNHDVAETITCNEIKPPLDAPNNEDKRCNEVNTKKPLKAPKNEDKTSDEVNTNSEEVKPPLKVPNNEANNEANTYSNEVKPSRINGRRSSTICLMF